MSQVLKLSSKDAKSWLEHETGSAFIPVHAKAQKLIEEMRRALASLTEVSKMLLDNSAREIEKRNMKTYKRARALNKLARLFVDRMRQVQVPDKVTYDSFNKFVQETQKAFTVTDLDVRNWFPRISPFFILDRRKFLAVFERAKLTLNELSDFLTKEYVKTKTLEETFQLVDKLSTLEQQLVNLGERKTKVENDRISVEGEIAETQQRKLDLKSKGSISQLNQTGTEIETLCVEVKQNLQHLQKPFLKLQSLATHGEGSGLTPEELAKLDQYLENSFEALSTESRGHPILKQILRKLDNSIASGKLKLKPEKIRKAEQAIDNILNKSSLTTLHDKCTDAVTRKAQLSMSQEVAEMQQNLSKLQTHIEDLTRKKGVIEAEESSLRRSHDETLEKIKTLKSEIGKNVLSFTGKTVHIE